MSPGMPGLDHVFAALSDPTRRAIVARLAVGENAVFDGWTKAAVDAAAGQLGIDPVQARSATPWTPASLAQWAQQ